MELFLAQNHAPLTHIPIAASILAALAAIASLFYKKQELTWMWAILAIVAFVACIPTIVTGVLAAIGRFYIEEGFIVPDTPENADIRLHQQLGSIGAIVALIGAVLGVRRLMGKMPNKILVVAVSLTLAVMWGIGGHMGGKALWAPETFPAYEDMLPDDSDG
ncbi:MAG: hypothetical protein CL946_05450 [Ectothiorhodospiraceae bacterium]|nr:hypothetical protein [Ectothiorhodospiraceae bacterium]